jgi:hypothetical protein
MLACAHVINRLISLDRFETLAIGSVKCVGFVRRHARASYVLYKSNVVIGTSHEERRKMSRR